MLNYTIKINPQQANKPYLFIPENEPYWVIVELNSCDIDYLLNEVKSGIVNLQNNTLNEFEFGFDSCIITLNTSDCSIEMNYGEKTFTCPARDMINLMEEWFKHLTPWLANTH